MSSPSPSSSSSSSSLFSVISEEIQRNGPIPFSRFQELALYHPQLGFYAIKQRAGRHSDFITSPELGTLFAEVLSKALDHWWQQLSKPDPFFIFEAGAGTGTLARDIIAAKPACINSMQYLMIERSDKLRQHQLGEIFPNTSCESVASVKEFPAGSHTGVVLANELLDNLPVDIYQRQKGHWYACCVQIDQENKGCFGFSETLVPVNKFTDDFGELINTLDGLAPNAADGSRIPLQLEARNWLDAALTSIKRGKIVCFDYIRTTNAMSSQNWSEWLRTYKSHDLGTEPYEFPGSQDITCDVAVDQLALLRPPDRDQTQADFLYEHGLDELVNEARGIWHSRAAIGDLVAVKALGRINEANALTDPNGLGAHHVLEWNVE